MIFKNVLMWITNNLINLKDNNDKPIRMGDITGFDDAEIVDVIIETDKQINDT